MGEDITRGNARRVHFMAKETLPWMLVQQAVPVAFLHCFLLEPDAGSALGGAA